MDNKLSRRSVLKAAAAASVGSLLPTEVIAAHAAKAAEPILVLYMGVPHAGKMMCFDFGGASIRCVGNGVEWLIERAACTQDAAFTLNGNVAELRTKAASGCLYSSQVYSPAGASRAAASARAYTNRQSI
jgi:hypothetical protein